MTRRYRHYRRYSRRRDFFQFFKLSFWGVVIALIVILFIGYLVSNNTYINYNETTLSKDYKCSNGKVIAPSAYFPSPESECNLNCYRNDYKRKIELDCNNGKPMCICKATVFSVYIRSLF